MANEINLMEAEEVLSVPSWKLENRKLSKLKDYPHNPRIQNKHQYQGLKRSIKKFGVIEKPCITPDGTIIGGHQRTKVFKDSGIKELEVWVPDRDLTAHEVKELNMTLNKSGGDFDIEMVANLFSPEELLDTGWTPEEMGGFSPEEVQEIESEKDESEDEAPDIAKETQTKKGDLYELGEHRLLCGDSVAITDVERLLDSNTMDMVYTDPPYGISIQKKGGNVGGGKLAKVQHYEHFKNDISTETAKDAYNLCSSMGIEVLIFWGANYYAESLPPSSCWIVWDKENTGNFSDVELAWCNLKRASRIYKQMWNGMIREGETGKEVQPTQKPIALAEWCFDKFSPEGKHVLDLFGGSGSTLIACEKTNRHCYMIELSPHYCDVIVKRWQEFQKKNGQSDIVKRNGEIVEMLTMSVKNGEK